MYRRFAFAAMAALVMATPLAAQKITQIHPGKGGSPHVRAEYTIDGATITVEYGRPSVKGRTIFGPDGIVKPGAVWRMGADEATTLTTTKDLMFGSVHVPAGKYTLYALPLEGAAPDQPAGKLIINKQTGQWGTVYDEKQDLGRVDAVVTIVEKPTETLTISFVDTPQGGKFVMEFANIRAEAPFMVH